MKKYISIFCLFISSVFSMPSAFATVWTTVASGPVTTLANWSDGTSSPTSFATPGDTWVILHNMTNPSPTWSTPGVWILGTASLAPSHLEIGATGSLKTTNNSTILVVYGNMTVNGGKYLHSGNSFTDSVDVYGDLTISGDSFAIKGTVPTSKINVHGSFTMYSGTFNARGTSLTQNIDVAGNFTIHAGTFTQTGTSNTSDIVIHGDLQLAGGSISGSDLDLNVLGSSTINGALNRSPLLFNTSGPLIVNNGSINSDHQNITCAGLTVNNGSLTGSSTGMNANITVNGGATLNTATLTMTGTSVNAVMNIWGDCNINSGNYYTSATGGDVTFNVHGDFSLIDGLFQTNGNTANFIYNIYGDCSIGGTATVTNSSAHGKNEFHLMLPSSSGTMLANNSCTGTWTKTYVYVDTGCIAQLNGNFNLPVTPVSFNPYGMVVNGTLICPAACNIYGVGAFTLNGVASIYSAHPAGLNGNIASTGTKAFHAKANYIFNGTAAQATGTNLPISLQAPGTLTIDNTAGVSLSQNTATTGTLSFVNGILHTGTYALTTPGTPGVITGVGLSSYIDGKLVKNITGLSVIDYEVGSSSYTPMRLTLSAAGTAGSLGVRCSNGLHPAISSSFVLSTNTLNCYWTINSVSAAGPATVLPSVEYGTGDVIGGSNLSFTTQKYSGSAWLAAALATTNTVSPHKSVLNAALPLSSVSGDYIFGVSCGSPILGTTQICNISGTTVLSNATSGGAWSISDPSVATISTSGVVTGVSPGIATVLYTTSMCSLSTNITVGVLPIVGTTTICPSSTTSLSSSTPGGVWSSSNISVASVNTAGIVSAMSSGTANISYTVGTCPPVVALITVPTLSGITGSPNVYVGSSVNLSNATAGGVWSTGNAAIATVSPSGVVYGVSSGVTNISYAVGSCFTVFSVNVMHHYLIIADSICAPSDTLCSSPKFYVKVNGWSSLLRLKTYYGDGTSDSIMFMSLSGTSFANASHAYTTPGCYSIKQVIYFNNIPHDSISFTYHHQYCRTFQLKFFVDANGDCIKNGTEVFNTIPINVIVDSMGVAIDTLSATSGFYYSAFGSPGTIYSFRLMPSTTYSPCALPGILYDTVLATVASVSTKNFALSCNISNYDLITVVPKVLCGFHAAEAKIIIQNAMCLPKNGTLEMSMSPKYTIVSSSTPGFTTSGNTATWLVNSLSSATGQVVINARFTGHATVGDTVNSRYSISPVAGDMNTGNNTCIRVDTVKSSYDPNSVEVTPAGCFDDDTTFEYTVHFENMGNDTAHNIYIMDTLGDYVDISSLRIVAATAEMDVYVVNNGGVNVIKFDFPNIKLLDSSYHGLCDGAVVYKINRRFGMPDGAKLTNTAGIYFDTNPVVMTNTVENVKGCPPPVAIPVVAGAGANLFPNPTTHTLTIKTTQQQYTTYTITNSVGQTLLQQSLTGAQTTADVHTLPSGVYYVTLRGSGAPVTLKFVKM